MRGNPRAAHAAGRGPAHAPQGSLAPRGAHAAHAAQAAPPREAAAGSSEQSLRRSPLRRVLRALSAALLALAVALAAALAGVRLVGLTPYAVLSGSMEPAYPVGSVVYVRDVDPADVVPGDVITFALEGGTVATHRVVEVVQDGGSVAFRTKGDANDAVDGGLVRAENVAGEVVASAPWLGYASAWLQTASGRWAAIAVCALLAASAFLPEGGARSRRARR